MYNMFTSLFHDQGLSRVDFESAFIRHGAFAPNAISISIFVAQKEVRPMLTRWDGRRTRTSLEPQGQRCVCRVFSRLEEPKECMCRKVATLICVCRKVHIAAIRFDTGCSLADGGLYSS